MPKKPLQIALIGDRNGDYLPHTSAESIIPKLSNDLNIQTEVTWVCTGNTFNEDLSRYDIIWSGSGPYLDPEGAMHAIQFAREKGIPFIGTCSGFKYTIIELAKNVCKAKNCEDFISLNESCGRDYKDLHIELHSNKTQSYYGSSNVIETSHCRFEINPDYLQEVNDHLTFAGTADDGRMVIAELTNHPFFLATLFLPQLNQDSLILKQMLKVAQELSSQK